MRFSNKMMMVLLGGLAVATAVHANDLAKDIARIHLEAIGGMERLERLKSFRAAGQSRVGEVTMDFQMWAARPRAVRIEVQTGGQMLVQGWDGETEPWVRAGNDGVVHTMPGDLGARFKSESDFDTPLYRSEERGFTIEYAGEGEVNGRPVVKLLAVRDVTDQSILHLAADTYFVVRQDKVRYVADGSRVESSTYYDDFRSVMGVTMPHRIRMFENDHLVSDVMLQWMEPNPPLEEGWFDHPAPPVAVEADLKAPAAAASESIRELAE